MRNKLINKGMYLVYLVVQYLYRQVLDYMHLFRSYTYKRDTLRTLPTNKEFTMGYTTLNQLQAHWLYIPHNPRNNKRTKPAK